MGLEGVWLLTVFGERAVLGLRAADFFAGAFFTFPFAGLFLRTAFFSTGACFRWVEAVLREVGFRAVLILDVFELFFFGVFLAILDFFCASIFRRPFLMAAINSSLRIPDVPEIFLRRAIAVNSVLVLFDKSEVRFISSSPEENFRFLSGLGKTPAGSLPIVRV